jgi:hypothetical protein
MNRLVFAIALGAGMSLMGCATGVDDPVPQAPAPEAQKDPPAVTLSGELRDPQQQLLSGIEINNGFGNVPAHQVPPGPQPIPEQH